MPGGRKERLYGGVVKTFLKSQDSKQQDSKSTPSDYKYCLNCCVGFTRSLDLYTRAKICMCNLRIFSITYTTDHLVPTM